MIQPGLKLFDTFNEVANNVKNATGKSQVPWMSASAISGDFYFAGGPAAAATPAQALAMYTPSGGDAEIVFWQTIENSKDPNDFEAYLKQYPAGRFSALAQVRRSELNSPKPVASATPVIPSEVVAHGNGQLLPPHQSSPLPNLSPTVSPPIRRQRVAVIKTPSVALPVPNQSLSQSLSDYLHHNRLPYVDALVLSDQSRRAKFAGAVRACPHRNGEARCGAEMSGFPRQPRPSNQEQDHPESRARFQVQFAEFPKSAIPDRRCWARYDG